MAHSDQARETDGSAVAQRDAPSPTEHPELGILLHHPEVAQERELEAPSDRVAVDRGDGGFRERPATRAERPVAIGLIELMQGALGDRLEVVAGAERLALSAQDRNRRLGIVIERLERVLELQGGRMVDGVAGCGRLSAIVETGPSVSTISDMSAALQSRIAGGGAFAAHCSGRYAVRIAAAA